MADPIPQIKTTDAIGKEPMKTGAQPGKPFSSYMKEGSGANPLLESGKSPQISPFDLAAGKTPAPGPTLQSIQNQSKMAQSTLGDLQNQLKTPKLKLRQSTKYLLKNKLSSALGNIRSANQKMGAPTMKPGEEQAMEGAGPFQKFINLLTGGQKELQSAQEHLANLAKDGKQIQPGEMLMIQVKISKAQQQLEYSSLLLGKAVDDIKMMMNIQI